MGQWVYESHLGSLYVSNWQISIDSLYCDECGDYDQEIGCFETFADFL